MKWQKSKPIISALKMLVLLFLITLMIRLTLQNFHIQGHSMEPTLHDQEYVVVSKVAYLLQPPARGDVIVFQYPHDLREDYVKRIIAVPGDIISVIGQAVSVNGVNLKEPYIDKQDPYNPFQPFRNRIVGPDDYFVMGDNRGNSSDSRQWGFVPRKDIIGRAVVVYWPWGEDNLGIVPDVGNVFAQVK